MASPATLAPARASSWVDTLGGVVRESKRIVAAHTRHFLALSVLFLLPLSLLLVAAPPLFATPLLRPDPLLPPHETLLRGTAGGPLSAFLACACAAAAAALLALCAAAVITHSVRDGFFGRPVRVAAALRSLSSSLWRLLLTSLSAAVVLAAYAAIITSIFLLCLHVLPFLGFHEGHLDPTVFATAAAAVMVLGAVYLQVNWALAGVVAVAESNWGFDPLRRSAHLVKGMRWGVLCLILFFSVATGLVLWSAERGWASAVEDWPGAAPVVTLMVWTSAVTVVILLYSLVSTTVLYIYCKALHGELAGEIAEEFAREYVCLPFDDRKVPHIVSVIWQ
ncbi:hypothetical protein Taro_019933 [Colocasia esculenta]|uniref:Uncharacterized protein n=1 Tax=Colocasia esculenta TaxID=4460 RepID=A0A843UXM1_COLES|nr:hypothetical protein [Colocasia esculenta]